MYNQTDDVKGIRTVGIIVVVAFTILTLMNVLEVVYG